MSNHGSPLFYCRLRQSDRSFAQCPRVYTSVEIMLLYIWYNNIIVLFPICSLSLSGVLSNQQSCPHHTRCTTLLEAMHQAIPYCSLLLYCRLRQTEGSFAQCVHVYALAEIIILYSSFYNLIFLFPACCLSLWCSFKSAVLHSLYQLCYTAGSYASGHTLLFSTVAK